MTDWKEAYRELAVRYAEAGTKADIYRTALTRFNDIITDGDPLNIIEDITEFHKEIHVILTLTGE
jgi:hypothetical protein